ncbi:metal ABC transporter substrate-binding protein [Streptosporangium sp. NPDC001559]|uniref:metal ABC transporter substrate-binding protein n=1 Tax=Streptosporangium sp. NPDC001559 TaxID=3366187 RepID=UPI0036E2E921
MRTASLLAALTAVLTVTTACGSGQAGPAGAQGGKTDITAAMYPLQWLAERIGGPDATVTALTKPGVEPHDLELSPVQVAGIEETGLVVYVKDVQPAVDEAVEQHAAGRGLDVASLVKTIPSSPSSPSSAGEQDGGETGDAAHDPHVWLDPSRMATIATKLGDRLAEADPAHAKGYRDRAAATVADLTTLDGEMSRGLSGCSSTAIVTSHAAFGYLADRYKLRQIGINGIDPETEPSPARLAEVAKVAKQEKVTTIFSEALVSPKVAEVLSTEIGARTAVLDPVESQPANGDYLSAMRQNLSALQTALGCS